MTGLPAHGSDDGTRFGDYLVPHEIGRQPSVVRRVLEIVDPSLTDIAADVARRGMREIVMTGCGDSLFAAMGAAFAFATYAGRLTMPMHALEYSRGFSRVTGRGTLLCALSYSGETRRTLEAAHAARARNGTVLSVTADIEGSIARVSDHVLPNVSLRADERSNCRTGSFQAAYLALVLLAAHLGVAERTCTQGELAELQDELRRLADAIENALEGSRAAGEAAAGLLRSAGTVYFIGGGEAFAAALYGAAKLYEASSLPAVPQETEQFAHCEIFSLEPESVVVVVALRGPFYDRAVEVATAARLIGARVIGVSDVPGFASSTDLNIPIDARGLDHVAMSLAVLPLQWMAFYDAVWRGQDPDLVRHKAVNSPLIRQAPIWTERDYAAIGPTGAEESANAH